MSRFRHTPKRTSPGEERENPRMLYGIEITEKWLRGITCISMGSDFKSTAPCKQQTWLYIPACNFSAMTDKDGFQPPSRFTRAHAHTHTHTDGILSDKFLVHFLSQTGLAGQQSQKHGSTQQRLLNRCFKNKVHGKVKKEPGCGS